MNVDHVNARQVLFGQDRQGSWCLHAGILQGGMNIASIGFSGNFMTYESDVLFALRYMIDQSIVGCNWLELPPGSYRCTPASLKVSHCQLEVHANYERVVSHPAEGEWVKLSRFRILSVDIECAGRKVCTSL